MGAIYGRAILGVRSTTGRGKGKGKVDFVCEEEWLLPYVLRGLEMIKREKGRGQIRSLHPCQEEMIIRASGRNCKVGTLTQRNVGEKFLWIRNPLMLKSVGQTFMDLKPY